MQGHRSSGATKRAPARAQPFRAGGFCVVGSSNGSPVVPATGFALLLPTPQNPLDAGASASEKRALTALVVFLLVPVALEIGHEGKQREEQTHDAEDLQELLR